MTQQPPPDFSDDKVERTLREFAERRQRRRAARTQPPQQPQPEGSGQLPNIDIGLLLAGLLAGRETGLLDGLLNRVSGKGGLLDHLLGRSDRDNEPPRRG